MRSIQYIMGGAPRKFADCVDYARKHEVNRVTLALKEREEPSEAGIIERLIGVYVWDFDDRVVTYEEDYGGVVEPEDEERGKLSRGNANRRLERRLRDFEEFEISVENDHLRF